MILNIELSEQEAWDLAQLLKRFSFSDAQSCAVDDNEARRMIDVISKLQTELQQIGYNPR